jgi:hypothetical protein
VTTTAALRFVPGLAMTGVADVAGVLSVVAVPALTARVSPAAGP